jgi:hypothetical protein
VGIWAGTTESSKIGVTNRVAIWVEANESWNMGITIEIIRGKKERQYV